MSSRPMSSNEDYFVRGPHRGQKRRAEQACEACRRRRIRCNRSSIPGRKCIPCIDAQYDCTYSKKVVSRKSYAASLEARLEHSEALIRQLRSQLATAHFGSISSGAFSTTPASPFEGTNGPKSSVVGRHTLLTHVGRALGSLAMPPPPPDRDDLAHVDLAANFEQLHIGSAHQRRFVGKSSDEALVKVALDLKEDVKREERRHLDGHNNSDSDEEADARAPWTSRRIRFWTFRPWETTAPPTHSFKFPPFALMTELVGLYFTQQNIYVPLLHQPTFERSVAEGLHLRDLGFASTLLLVCAIGSRWSADPSVVSRAAKHGTGSLACGWEWFDQVPPPRDYIFGQTKLYDLQYYCLAAQFLEGGSEQRACWMLIGIGLRLAQDIGVHRRTAQVATPSVQSELLKRAFWALAYMDQTVSCAMGRTCTVQYLEFDLELPIDCNDEYWGHPEHPFQQPVGVPSRVSFLIAILRLNNLLSACLKLLYPLNKIRVVFYTDDSRKESVVAQLDSAVNHWRNHIPEHLRWDPAQTDPVFFDQSVALHCAYYYIQVLIHRNCIPILQEVAPMAVPSLAICTTAARACANILDIQRRRKGNVPVVINLSAAFTSVIILLLNMWSHKRMRLAADLTSEIANVHKCIAVVRLCEDRWQSPGLLWDILAELASVGQVSLPDASTSSTVESQDPDGPVESSSADTIRVPSGSLAPGQTFDAPKPPSESDTYPLLPAQYSLLTPVPAPEAWPSANEPLATAQRDAVHVSHGLEEMMELIDADAIAMWTNAPMGLEVDDWEKYFNDFNEITQNSDQNS
ncbi:fungal-specific transcription factor domain-containing protein [Mycena alexandri]|uniref:Fungal-specific transcription factor domain-containing protein n=1 Tax=Mycena alexandri TaxID=1745969 RepID=A0AAD6T9J0_9AGAR|nr:fungal-specific transcription factor domain-containing protein [Mycena alexandri]